MNCFNPTMFWIWFTLVSRAGFFILSTTVMDIFSKHDNQSNLSSKSTNDSGSSQQQTNVIFICIMEWITTTLIAAIVFICVFFKRPKKMIQNDQFHMKVILLNGVSTGIGNYLYNSSVSGQRTPPFLTGILSNIMVPLQFIVSYLMLKRRPTLIKLVCALLIIAAEVVCLLPTIFPWLESAGAHSDDGGDTGLAGVLWPLCYIISFFPSTISNGLIEYSTKKEETRSLEPTSKSNKPYNRVTLEDLLYYIFWWCVYGMLTFLCMSWMDVLPYFGTSKSFAELHENIQSGLLCIFGVSECPVDAIVLTWALFAVRTASMLSVAALIRYSEGSSFYAIILSLRTPIVFLFWSLVDDHPFHWHPHTHLSTWLSIGAISVMIPAVVCYDKGDSWYQEHCQKSILIEEEKLVQ